MTAYPPLCLNNVPQSVKDNYYPFCQIYYQWPYTVILPNDWDFCLPINPELII